MFVLYSHVNNLNEINVEGVSVLITLDLLVCLGIQCTVQLDFLNIFYFITNKKPHHTLDEKMFY